MTDLSVSVAIMHVPGSGRDANVAETVRRLPPSWTVTVIEDALREGCWPTAKKAWQARTPDSTHHLVLSDDAVLCDHFAELLIGALNIHPGSVLSLCARNRQHTDTAVLERCSWILSDDTVYGQGIVIPSPLVEEMLLWVERFVKPNYEHDDGRVGMWARATRSGVYTPVPQLVRHMEGPSLMGHPMARGLGTPLFAADRRDVNWDTTFLRVEGTLFGGRGLKADAPEELRTRLSAPKEVPKDGQLEALRERFQAAKAKAQAAAAKPS